MKKNGNAEISIDPNHIERMPRKFCLWSCPLFRCSSSFLCFALLPCLFLAQCCERCKTRASSFRRPWSKQSIKGSRKLIYVKICAELIPLARFIYVPISIMPIYLFYSISALLVCCILLYSITIQCKHGLEFVSFFCVLPFISVFIHFHGTCRWSF